MYLYGASGHGKVILDILKANGLSLSAFIDDNESIGTLSGYPVVQDYDASAPMIISIGYNAIRKKVAAKVGGNYISAVHPSAIVSDSVRIGLGSVVMQGAIIQADACVGEHAIINTGASVDHDCQIGDFTHISPHATVCGAVSLGEGSWIGAGATVIQCLKIGEWSVVAAGSVVTEDVPDGVLVAGVPAKIIKKLF